MEELQALPTVTRGYMSAALLTTVGCTLELITPLSLYFNPKLIMAGEVWRLITNFMYFGSFGIDFIFHMFFLLKYCKSLEEGSFRGRTADFLWMLLLGGALMSAAAPYVEVQFLGSSLTFMMVYVWARRHQYVTMSLLGLFTFTAPYLPWVLLGFSLVLGNRPVVDLLGIGAGHLYYFLEDVYPRMTGRRPLKTPGFVRALFPSDEPIVAPAMHPPPPAPAAPENFGAPDLAPVPAGHDQHAHA
mmetsp:Transcript_3684/g.10393  ORF Transcript_3684/g.10393 Transcript_3684/m.10393 type:complete len:244 (-) Transcript_3684:452-1183(-)